MLPGTQGGTFRVGMPVRQSCLTRLLSVTDKSPHKLKRCILHFLPEIRGVEPLACWFWASVSHLKIEDEMDFRAAAAARLAFFGTLPVIGLAAAAAAAAIMCCCCLRSLWLCCCCIALAKISNGP